MAHKSTGNRFRSINPKTYIFMSNLGLMAEVACFVGTMGVIGVMGVMGVMGVIGVIGIIGNREVVRVGNLKSLKNLGRVRIT